MTFADALAETHSLKRHLLLGNGFSIALFPDRFRYASLLEETNFSQIPEAEAAFKSLETTDFEVVIHALRQAVILHRIYDNHPEISRKMDDDAEILKELLVQAIAGTHPERPSDITEEQYQSCRQFLSHFLGDARSNINGKDRRGCVFTLNYDLLLYWALLHVNEDDDNAVILKHDDGFRESDSEHDAPYVSWEGEVLHTQCVYHLHGALHIYDDNGNVNKICWERSGGIPLVDQIRASLEEDKFPLFVSEGSSASKFAHIRHSAYLHVGLRKFGAQEGCLFVFGHSLAENDDHVLEQIERGKYERLYISLHGDASSEWNKKIIRRAEKIQRFRQDRKKAKALDIKFFDASSAKVWDAYSPLSVDSR